MEGFGFVKAHSNSWDEKRVIYRGMERRFYCLVKGVKFDSGNLRLPANHKKTLDSPDDDTWWVPYRDALCSVGSNCGASGRSNYKSLKPRMCFAVLWVLNFILWCRLPNCFKGEVFPLFLCCRSMIT
jgi:hypothetical protein